MSLSVNGFHSFEFQQVRENIFKKSSLVHQSESHRRMRGNQDFVEFLDNALLGKDGHPVAHVPHRPQGFRHDGELLLRGAEFRCETDRAKHPQGVVAVGLLRLQRGAYHASRKVTDAAERIHESAIVLFLETERHRIDCEVPALLILLERPVLDNGLARVVAVGLPARADKLNLRPVPLQHGGAESLEDGHVAVSVFLLLNLRGHSLGQSDSASLHDYVDVVVRPAEEAVPHITSYHESPYTKFLRGLRDYSENRVVKTPLRYCRTHHIPVSALPPNPGKTSPVSMSGLNAQSQKSSTRW